MCQRAEMRNIGIAVYTKVTYVENTRAEERAQ